MLNLIRWVIFTLAGLLLHVAIILRALYGLVR